MAEPLLATTVRLTGAAESLAALAAHVRVRTEGLTVDPALEALLAEIAIEMLGTADIGPADAGPQSVGMARALLKEASSLAEDPTRQGDWSTTDPTILQGVGRMSMAIAPVFAHAATLLPGLADALAQPDASFLDVGTGTGWLAMATARTFPSVRVVGIDVFEPALHLARQNIEAESMGARVELRTVDVTQLDERDEYDVIWLPLPFLPAAVVPSAIERANRALKPGGWVLPGTFAGGEDRLSRLLIDLRIRRSGGHPWRVDEMLGLLHDGGLVDAQEVERVWAAPVRLFAARRSR